MLNACLPFPTDKFKKLVQLELSKEFRFRSKILMRVSTEAVRLVESLLEPNWTKRPSAEESLLSPWMNLEPKLVRLTPIEEAALLKLDEFHLRDRIKIDLN